MATVHLIGDQAAPSAEFHGSAGLRAQAHEPPLFRFGLRQLLLFVAAMSTLMAALASWPGVPALVLLLFAAIVAAHVFATALAGRLRARTDRAIDQQGWGNTGGEAFSATPERQARLDAVRAAPRSPWHARGSTSLPWLPKVIVFSALAGCVGGVVLLSATVGHRVTLAGIVVGSCSMAVLCAWCAFLVGSFYGVFRHGFREALAEQQRDQISIEGRDS
jgi:hypothetical protein